MLRNLIDLDRLSLFWDNVQSYIDNKKINVDNVPTLNSKNPVSSGGVYTALQGKADTEDVPTKLSDLTDDATHRVVTDTEKSTWNGKATTTDITNAINALDVSSVGGSGKYISAISEIDGKISATATDMPTIPDSLSDLDDDATHRLVTDTEKSTWSGKADNAPTFTEASTRANIASGETISTLFGKIKKFFTDLKAVAFSGSYNDLTDKPTIPAAQVNSDWNATSGVALILNKPTIPAAANNGTLTIQKNGTSVATFTANQSSNVTANITVPTDYIADSLKGAANGVAELDSNGKVPASQLPSYVDDVLEYTNKASFPATGEEGKIYIDKATNRQYRWSGTAYVEISESLALGETSSTAYAGNKGKANADAIAVLNGTGAGSVSKAVSDAIGALDVSSVGGSGKYISAISETNGKISATAANMPTSLPASDVYAWAKASTKPSYSYSEITDKPTTATLVVNPSTTPTAEGSMWIVTS